MFEWFEDEVRALEASRTGILADMRPVAFYGSSSIRLWATLAEDFAGDSVVNLGFGGSTLQACAYFFDRLVPPFRPRSLILYAGDNDLGDGRLPDAILASLRELLAEADAACPGIPIAYISVKPSPARWQLIDRIRAVNSGAQALMTSRPLGLYLDVYTPMLTDSGGARSELYQPDGLHLNREGYRVWWQVVAAERAALFL